MGVCVAGAGVGRTGWAPSTASTAMTFFIRKPASLRNVNYVASKQTDVRRESWRVRVAGGFYVRHGVSPPPYQRSLREREAGSGERSLRKHLEASLVSSCSIDAAPLYTDSGREACKSNKIYKEE